MRQIVPVYNYQIPSTALRETRIVSVFLPSEEVRIGRLPVLFCADGQALQVFCERLTQAMEHEEVPPTILVGAHSSDQFRPHEYVLGIDHERFAAHERFFTEEVYGWARDRLGVLPPRQSCGVFGFSNGAAFALAMGARRREQFGVVIAFSVAGGADRIEESAYVQRPSARYYLSSGTRKNRLAKPPAPSLRLSGSMG